MSYLNLVSGVICIILDITSIAFKKYGVKKPTISIKWRNQYSMHERSADLEISHHFLYKSTCKVLIQT
jgi:hypothetical protein